MARRTMGLDFGLEGISRTCKRKNRWLFYIPNVSAGNSDVDISTLPPVKSARPYLTFQEMQAKHLNEDIYYPAKPDWKPVPLVLYDLVKNNNPIFDWIKLCYDPSPQMGTWVPSTGNENIQALVTQEARLDCYDGCGELIESRDYEKV